MAQNELIQILDKASRISVVIADCTEAAVTLARFHLSGSTASYYLAQALAGVALLGAETSQIDETVTWRLQVPGQLKGFLVECTEAGTLRGYTQKKILNDFDGLGKPRDQVVLGESGTFEVIRSIPGSILSSGAVATDLPTKNALAKGLDAYFQQSLQRRVCTALVSDVSEDAVPCFARGILMECPPDGDTQKYAEVAEVFANGSVAKALATGAASTRTVLKKLGLPLAEIRKTSSLRFACRCSAERAIATLATLSAAERAQLPEQLDVTCHLCGRTWTIKTKDL